MVVIWAPLEATFPALPAGLLSAEQRTFYLHIQVFILFFVNIPAFFPSYQQLSLSLLNTIPTTIFIATQLLI